MFEPVIIEAGKSVQELCRGARADDEDEVYACRMMEDYLTELHTSRDSLEFQTKNLDRDLWALSAAKMQAVTARVRLIR